MELAAKDPVAVGETGAHSGPHVATRRGLSVAASACQPRSAGRKQTRVWAAFALVVALLAGCGGGGLEAQPASSPVVLAPGQPCNASYQCAPAGAGGGSYCLLRPQGDTVCGWVWGEVLVRYESQDVVNDGSPTPARCFDAHPHSDYSPGADVCGFTVLP